MSKLFALRTGLAALMLAGTASFGSTAVIGPISGNECAGQGGFSNCELTIGGNATPAVIKFNSNFEVSDVSTGFPSVTGEEFSFFDIVTSPGEVEGASFTYTLGADDPGITGFAVFAAGDYLLYDSSEISFSNGVYTGAFSTAGLGNNANNPTPGLSHLTFFDTAIPGDGSGDTPRPSPIPLPASALLLLAGVAGLGAIRKRT